MALCGADKGVGIFGWTSGGGHGPLTRLYGLGVDALISIDIIISNFTVITASETQNQELFRAIRGSGGSTYGIGVSLTIRLYDDPGNVSFFTGFYNLNTITSSMFENWIINAPNFSGAYYVMEYIDEDQYVIISAHCFSNASTCMQTFEPLKPGCIPSIIPDSCLVNEYNNYYQFLNSTVSNTVGYSLYFSSTALNAANILSALGEITNFISKNQNSGCYANSILGGVSSTMDLNQVQTSVSKEMRTSLTAITCYSLIGDSDKVAVKKYQVEVMNQLAETIFKKYSNWVYWNEPQHEFPSNDWKERYWGGLDNYNRLLTVKTQYDPENFFSCYHCVGYERIENEDPAFCPQLSCTCSNTPNGVCNSSILLKSNLFIMMNILVFMLINVFM